MVKTKLTSREREIAELIAWGASKKDVAEHLFISERTVENHTRNIYQKVGCGKVNELSAWWFCTRFEIPVELSPLRKKIISVCMLLIMLPQIYNYDDGMVRQFRARTRVTNTRGCRSSRRKNEVEYTN